jgi:hypothetical protein
MEYSIKGDGACQFASIADQLFKDPSRAQAVRAQVIKQLQTHPEYYVEFVENESYVAYCHKMSLPATWGDHLTLQAAADHFRIVINLITSYQHAPHIEIRPRGSPSNSNQGLKVIWLSFFGEVHYNSLYTHEAHQNRLERDETCTIS